MPFLQNSMATKTYYGGHTMGTLHWRLVTQNWHTDSWNCPLHLKTCARASWSQCMSRNLSVPTKCISIIVSQAALGPMHSGTLTHQKGLCFCWFQAYYKGLCFGAYVFAGSLHITRFFTQCRLGLKFFSSWYWFKKKKNSWLWWWRRVPLIPALERQRQ